METSEEVNSSENMDMVSRQLFAGFGLVNPKLAQTVS